MNVFILVLLICYSVDGEPSCYEKDARQPLSWDSCNALGTLALRLPQVQSFMCRPEEEI